MSLHALTVSRRLKCDSGPISPTLPSEPSGKWDFGVRSRSPATLSQRSGGRWRLPTRQRDEPDHKCGAAGE